MPPDERFHIDRRAVLQRDDFQCLQQRRHVRGHDRLDGADDHVLPALAAAKANPELQNNLSAAAHLIHGSSEGRFGITYCPGHLTQHEIEGVGFKAQSQGKTLNLLLGFTHPVVFDIPEGLTVETPKPTQVFIKGTDKVKVGHFAAKIRKVFVAEPYKGKGVRYVGEVVRRKAGKTVTK